jgi:hypothetical protein
VPCNKTVTVSIEDVATEEVSDEGNPLCVMIAGFQPM